MIDRAALKPAALLSQLIRCASVTPSEAGALSIIEKYLIALGFFVERPLFGEGQAAVENLYARLGDASPCLVFAGHSDVVPPGDEGRWRYPPFGGEIVDGFVYGRGAVDMKGGIAAMLSATARYVAANPPKGSIAFIITGDEEGPA